MRAFLLITLLSATFILRAQIPIADARTTAVGTTVTVQGVVTSGAELGSIRYVQDATAGIAAYPGTGSAPGFTPSIGDNITVTGVLTDYNGLLEINPITAFTINTTGNVLPAPVLVTPNGVNETTEGSLVRIIGAQFANAGSVFASGADAITSSGETGSVYISTGTGLVGSAVPAGLADITGIASQYDNSIPATSGYRVLPRNLNDIVNSGAINAIGAVTQSNITTSGFDLSWSTYGSSSSEVQYGLTTALGSSISNTTPVMIHSLPINSLQPATFYYARVFSVIGPDTAFSPIALYSTASNSTGVIRTYFNQAVDHSVSSGVDAISLGFAVDDTIAAYIDRAQFTIDAAIYNASDNLLITALNNAVNRGVQIRYITQGSNSNTALASLDASVPVWPRMDNLGSGMHDKFVVIDADDAQRAWLLTGSVNWTTSNLFDDYNNLVFFQDQSLARCYRREFEEMWGGSGPQPNGANSKFGPYKTDNTPHLFNIGGVKVESYFSPSDHTTSHIHQQIDSAAYSMRCAMYVFTEQSLGSATINAHNRPGTTVQLDVEDAVTAGSELWTMAQAGVEIASHSNDGVLLHHKYAIFDEGTPHDPRVETGSHNWTVSAETVNDENSLVIHDATVANLFYQEWHALHATVNSISENAGNAVLDVWPVPASDHLNIAMPEEMRDAILTIRDLSGREMLSMRSVTAMTSIDVSSLADGIYVLCAASGDQRAQRVISVAR